MSDSGTPMQGSGTAGSDGGTATVRGGSPGQLVRGPGQLGDSPDQRERPSGQAGGGPARQGGGRASRSSEPGGGSGCHEPASVQDSPELQKWTPAALALDVRVRAPRMPWRVLLDEAVTLARFFEAHWDACSRPERRPLPGLCEAARDSFHAGLGRELLELCAAVLAADTRYRWLPAPPGPAPSTEARLLLRELSLTLQFMFDDGLFADDARLQQLADVHRDARSHDALAAALSDYAGFARRYAARMHGLGGFDAGTIDDAKLVAQALRRHSAARRAGIDDERRQAKALRQRLCALLYQRMQRVRTAARFVFRDHPEIARGLGSDYERRRKAALRRRAT